MIIVPVIVAILVGVVAYFLSGFFISDITKISRILISVGVFVLLAGFFTYKIYKGVYTLPEGAYYIDENDLTEDGVFKSETEKENGSKSN